MSEKTIKIAGKTFAPMISAAELQARVNELGATIWRENASDNPLFIVMLSGAYVFAADLLRTIPTAVDMAFVKYSSYEGTQSTGSLKREIGLPDSIKGRTCIVVEDIIDSGVTMKQFAADLKEKGAANVKIASLLIKPENNKTDIKADYFGFEISKEFVIGYGLDFDGNARNLDSIYKCID
ncbi:MAG: hypoxanthine phosphoribosyltransferase [Bacteroidales bacterium]|nr:hypoxanthine phosphoribosyltransferase [Candidatus Scybalocola fimicaballi]